MAIENKLGLTSSADLAREEERISKKKALVLFENGVFNKLEAGKFSALKAIHKYLFDEIFDFAGELRTVNISKGNFRFAPLMYLQATLANITRMMRLKYFCRYPGKASSSALKCFLLDSYAGSL